MKRNIICPKCLCHTYRTSDNVYFCKRCKLTIYPKGEKDEKKPIK